MQCKQCNSDWNSTIIVTNCPFCHAILPVVKTYDPNSVEGKIVALVKQFSPEIYNQPSKLNALILDLLNGEEIIGLLKKIIDENASVECYKLKGLSGNNFNINYNKAIDIVSSKTYIIKETITPAFNLLCIGLGIDVPTVVTPAPQVQAQPTNIKDFTINNGVLEEYIGAGGDVVIPAGVTSIGETAFKNCDSLTTIVIPNSVNAILDEAFCNCQNLTSVKLPMSVTLIEPAAFASCKSLKSIDIPTSITSISDRTFFRCESLTNIVIPDSVKKIGYRAFNYCTNLTTVDIPMSVNWIGDVAFSCCKNLSKDTINKIKAINPKAY